MATPPAIGFTAKDYSNELAQLRRAMPQRADEIENLMVGQYKDRYIEEIMTQEHKGLKGWALRHDKLISKTIFGGFMLGGIGAAAGLAVTVMTAGAVAPLAMVAGCLTVSAGSYKLNMLRDTPDDLARKKIVEDTRSGELIKFCIEASKRFDRILPQCLDSFDDAHMARHYSTVIEVGALSQIPLLNLAFESNADKKTLPAPAAHDQIRQDQKTPKP